MLVKRKHKQKLQRTGLFFERSTLANLNQIREVIGITVAEQIRRGTELFIDTYRGQIPSLTKTGKQ
jgi:hypothetical protein